MLVGAAPDAVPLLAIDGEAQTLVPHLTGVAHVLRSGDVSRFDGEEHVDGNAAAGGVVDPVACDGANGRTVVGSHGFLAQQGVICQRGETTARFRPLPPLRDLRTSWPNVGQSRSQTSPFGCRPGSGVAPYRLGTTDEGVAAMTTTSTDQAASRRDDLLRAAAERFVANGIRATTMEDIAAAAGAGKATLYRYFPNKDGVIDELLTREGRRLQRRLVGARDGAGGGLDGIRAAFIAGIRFLTTHPILLAGREEEPAVLLERALAAGGPMVEPSLKFWAASIRAAAVDGDVARVDAEVAAEIIVRVTLSYFILPPMVLDVSDDAQMDLLATEVIMRGLGPGRH